MRAVALARMVLLVVAELVVLALLLAAAIGVIYATAPLGDTIKPTPTPERIFGCPRTLPGC